MEEEISVWEAEGGALRERHTILTGSLNQVEWAERLRAQVKGEFDRVEKVLEAARLRQSAPNQRDTRVMIAILNDKRDEVMANGKSGYFIHEWQELGDQVRSMITSDARYKALSAVKARGQSRSTS